MMKVFWKRVITGTLAFVGCIGVATFTAWRFDPESWDAPARFLFALSTIFLTVFCASFPFKGD